DALMDTYLALQASTIFQHVGVMIYYYRDWLAALQQYSPDAAVFLLVHKMELASGSRAQTLERKALELQQASGSVSMTVFGTNYTTRACTRRGPG
ncbi:uncharacterized protein B0H18DRAFT_1021277, partial [Fomitopsis serialis]|uniref:uncharacterized protein n=1 Tax=Fomitopsis serialis TaxID=139415 RepID=UPI002007AE51